MENKIIFLIIIMLCLWLVFSQKGQEWLEYYLGIKVASKTSKKKEYTNDYSGDFGSGKNA